jgi:hypothetical protein
MKATVCTLFEGHYHYGVAALVNSLHAHGFRGTVWAGYRGALPPWARGESTLPVSDGLTLRFIPLGTPLHFTNYKAAFALEVLEQHDRAAEAVFYFDPDVFIAGRWGFYEDWVECGVALCEDVNSPMPETHPIRGAWRRFGAQHGLALRPRTASYVNAGFIGASRAGLPFLRRWIEILAVLQREHDVASILHWEGKDRTFPFFRPDQDALNMTLEASDVPLSIVGREGMGFGGGGYIMYHSLGEPKPWRKHFVWEAVKGWPPTSADKAFLEHSAAPIAAYPAPVLAAKRASAFLAGALCRLVRKGGW